MPDALTSPVTSGRDAAFRLSGNVDFQDFQDRLCGELANTERKMIMLKPGCTLEDVYFLIGKRTALLSVLAIPSRMTTDTEPRRVTPEDAQTQSTNEENHG